MPERERPTDFKGAMEAARLVTDQREEIYVYLDVARRLVRQQIGKQVSGLPLSEATQQELIEAEAYSMAQPAHLSDASTYEPVRLLEMLDSLGVFGATEE